MKNTGKTHSSTIMKTGKNSTVNKWKDRLAKLAIIALVIAVVVVLFWNVWVGIFRKISYHYRYDKEISFCKSIERDDAEFESVRTPKDNIRQYIFEVNENTSYDSIVPLLKELKEYCKDHLKSGMIYQIILSSNVSAEFPVGTPLVILTNQKPITGAIDETESYIHLCCLDRSSKWRLAHLTGSSIEFADEVVLCGSFDSLEPLSKWDNLKLCIYKGRSYFTYEIFDQSLITEEDWNRMKSSKDYSFEIAEFSEYTVTIPYLGTEYS
ncbi:MAG: hypothetical protein K6E26_07870 [Clostridiales bacterium]|nr:hypothetical protein [Clostridiales bacterium]